MKKIMQWVMAATLVCGTSVFTSCVDNQDNNPVTPEPEVPVVPDHFINETWMDKTINPGDDFYMYALGTWYTTHDDVDQGFVGNYAVKNDSEILNSLYTSDNPLAKHLIRNMKAPRTTLAENVKDILDYLDIQKPTGIGMLLTEIGKLQDKGLNPIFSKKEYGHPQTHSYVEMVSVGLPALLVKRVLGGHNTELMKSFIKKILTAIDEVSDPERLEAEGYEAELEERTAAILDEERLIYDISSAIKDENESFGPERPHMRGVRNMPAYIEAATIPRGGATRAGGGVKDEVSIETLTDAFHPTGSAIIDDSPFFREYLEKEAGITTVLKTMDRCYDYLRYYAVISVYGFTKSYYEGVADETMYSNIISLLGQVSPLLMNKLNYDFLKAMGQGGVDRCSTMLEEMRTLLRQRIETLDWLSDATRQEALKKLEAMQFYVGLPDNFGEDEFTLDDDNTLVQDVLSIMAQNETIKRKLCGKKIEQQPRAAIDYEVSYGELNACYEPLINALVILPQFLSEGIFPRDDEYTQYAVASVFGHEMTHGFDASGAKYDELGYKRNWWTPEDSTRFKAKQQEMVALYNRLEAFPGQKANGERTLGENMADYGGLTLTYTIFKQKKAEEGYSGAALDHACREFFLHYAKLWQGDSDLERLKTQYYIDVHSSSFNRVNGIVTLFDDWYRLFNVTDGQLYLAPEKRVRIW